MGADAEVEHVLDGDARLPLGARARVERVRVVGARGDELGAQVAVVAARHEEQRDLLALRGQALPEGEPRLDQGVERVVEDGGVIEPVGGDPRVERDDHALRRGLAAVRAS